MSKHQHTPASAAVGIEHAIRMLEGRWKLVILFHLFGGRKLRFSDLERAIPAISQKMLIQQLRQLERDGIVARIVHAQVPPKVEYHLTNVGAVPVPGARQAPHVGGETALIPKWFAKCEGHPPSRATNPQMAFRVLIIGGTGQVGAAVVRALAAEPSCAEVVMVNRKAISLTADPRLRQVILDTAAAQFPAEVTKLAQSMVAQGDPVYGASCVGVGKGSMKWSEEELKALEIGVVGGFARGCHAGGITQFALLSAAGSTAKSRIRYVRVMGLKEETVQGIGFKSLAIFRPGIIAGNAHTPSYAAWLGRLIPGPFGTIEQDDIGRAFVAEFISSSAPNGVVYLENGAMRQRSRAFK